MTVGENPKMPYPQCGRNIKTYARVSNDAPSITKYGSTLRLDAKKVALRPHCAKGAPLRFAKNQVLRSLFCGCAASCGRVLRSVALLS